jgi:hypothetical protein
VRRTFGVTAAALLALTVTSCTASHSLPPMNPTTVASSHAPTSAPSQRTVTQPIQSLPTPGVPTSPAVAHEAVGTALAEIAALPVKAKNPLGGYTRARFGDAWTDANTDPLGHNGCDTRNDILRRELTRITLKANSNGCTVLTGTLADPYTGTTIPFVRGTKTSTAVEIDHVVSLGDAWQTRVPFWSPLSMVNFANDPLNLLAVSGPENEAKGDDDAADWLPPNKAYQCAYVARQIAVKTKYLLAVTTAEKTAMADVLKTCPAQSAPHE